MQNGTICNVVLDRGFGFVRTDGGEDCFFHVKDLVDMDFDATLQERRVKFEIVNGDRGPRAKAVQPVE